MNARRLSTIDDQVVQRIYGEFFEMPGLRLTGQQAQRLWGLDEQTCRELLELLVDTGFLCRGAHGMYTRASDGRGEWLRPELLKAGVRVTMPKIRQAV